MRVLIVSPYLGDLFGQEQVVRASTRLLRASGRAVFHLCDTVFGTAPDSDGILEIRGLSTIFPHTHPQKARDLHARARAFIESVGPDVIHIIDHFDGRFVDWLNENYPLVMSAHAVVHTCPAGSRLVPPATQCEKKSGWACVWHDASQNCLPFRGTARKAHAVYGYLTRRNAFRRIRRVIAVSRYIKEVLVRDGWDESRIDVVYNPVFPAARRATLTGKPLLVSAARLVPLKGVDLLLRSLSRIKHLEWEYRLAGDGPERPFLESLARDLGLADRVTFLGRLDQSDVHELFLAARAVIHPSIGPEAFGLAPAEASAMGVPVVSFDVPALDEVIAHEQNGLLVKSGDVEGLAKAIERVASDETLARRLAGNGPRLMKERFAPEKHLEGTLKAYEAMAARTSQSPIEQRLRKT